MTENCTTQTAALYSVFQSWAGSIEEHGLATVTVAEEYIEYPADSLMGDWHAVLWATDQQYPGFSAYAYDRMGGDLPPPDRARPLRDRVPPHLLTNRCGGLQRDATVPR